MGKGEKLKVKGTTKANALALFCIAVLSVCQLQTANCQLVSATLRADSNQIQIGDPLKIRLTLKHPNNLSIPFPVAADTLGNLETISVSKIDTTAEGNSKILSQVYTVSAYDSGEYHAGPVKIYFKNSSGELDSISSNDVPVTVNTLDVDTAKPFKAIKAPLDVPYSWREFIYYIIAGVLLIIAIVVGVILYKKYKKQKPAVVERPKPRDPAHIWARKELKRLEEEKLWQKDDVKLYYSRLTDILRYYLEFRYNWYAMENTTEEIESEMAQFNLKEKAKENLLSILRAADLVKFAKMIPAPDANIRAIESAYKFIDFTEVKETKEEKK
ncbi:MAG: hypothetical protein KA149_01445 [Chitinophagales bacterium]|nr:hypothetical protein [Chitinophagales bacterium]